MRERFYTRDGIFIYPQSCHGSCLGSECSGRIVLHASLKPGEAMRILDSFLQSSATTALIISSVLNFELGASMGRIPQPFRLENRLRMKRKGS
jgi:hypothetical protein